MSARDVTVVGSARAPTRLGLRTAEVAEVLDTGEASVKGALQRAQGTLGARLPAAVRERSNAVPASLR